MLKWIRMNFGLIVISFFAAVRFRRPKSRLGRSAGCKRIRVLVMQRDFDFDGNDLFGIATM